ncbi:hypothetical protein HDA32_001201 [Spinactinospora alkalitolerans]|uniref:Ribonuclease VapC n=1 Tax=Spinactinospora alkalitolerans TaxID=687207 RepID=A0A852TR92_9ACTN|nr:type II toxin-antitoxin system VapC family toxin [Spinactinospora alkalitolerans]NYE46081.1 hypothetical protein [Spinactinospora alkalitolerans]
MSYLLDTNVVSELRKKRPDPHVADWIQTVPNNEIRVSVLVLGELRLGVEQKRRRDPAQAEALERWLDGIETAYADRIVPITADVAQEWGRLNVPDPISTVDGLMAATAKVHGWTLVTRNTKDVAHSGAKVIDPFTPET